MKWRRAGKGRENQTPRREKRSRRAISRIRKSPVAALSERRSCFDRRSETADTEAPDLFRSAVGDRRYRRCTDETSLVELPQECRINANATSTPKLSRHRTHH